MTGPQPNCFATASALNCCCKIHTAGRWMLPCCCCQTPVGWQGAAMSHCREGTSSTAARNPRRRPS
eukprot:scaffold28774_cov34-Prasinocladus_malaysianus.AAC.2